MRKKIPVKLPKNSYITQECPLTTPVGEEKGEVAGGAKNESSAFILWARKPKIKANLVNFPRFSAFL